MEKTFTLTITGTKNAEWQGKFQEADGSKIKFQSVLELMKLINQHLEEPQ